MWFALGVLSVVAATAFGAAVTVSTAVMLSVLALAPALLVMRLWPGVQLPTASEGIHGTERKP